MTYLVIVQPDDTVEVYELASAGWEVLVRNKSQRSINQWLSRQGAWCLALSYAVEYVVSIWKA